MDGLHVLRRMRERKDATPVLILTALDGIDDRVQGLNCGADDYLVKPFSLRELEARIRALLRRTTGQSQLIVTHGRLHFDANARTAYAGDQVIELSVREFGLLDRGVYPPVAKKGGSGWRTHTHHTRRGLLSGSCN